MSGWAHNPIVGKPVAVTVKIAAVAAVGGLGLLTFGWAWTGGVFLALGIVLFIGAFAGAGAEIGLRTRGTLAAAEVLELREEQHTVKGETFGVWVAKVRYRDRLGVAHEGDIGDCSLEERAILQPGRTTTVRYDPDHPDSFLWIDDSEKASGVDGA